MPQVNKPEDFEISAEDWESFERDMKEIMFWEELRREYQRKCQEDEEWQKEELSVKSSVVSVC